VGSSKSEHRARGGSGRGFAAGRGRRPLQATALVDPGLSLVEAERIRAALKREFEAPLPALDGAPIAVRPAGAVGEAGPNR
jgi:hypothetical protein